MASRESCNISCRVSERLKASVLSLLGVLLILQSASCKTPVVSKAVQSKILIPDLYPNHYQFWLKTHPKAYVEFQQVCDQVDSNPKLLTDLGAFQAAHANLTFENNNYLRDINQARKVLDKICSKIKLIPTSCWGYERNCQIIHLMPVCENIGQDEADSPHKRRMTWFNQADFGYILERRQEMTKFCSPDKHSNDTHKSSLECTKYFRTCRGQNLFLDFREVPKRASIITEPLEVIKSVGGFNCDLQRLRVKEEGAQPGILQSWFNELRGYDLIHGLDPSAACELTIEKQVYIVKLDYPNNMYHYFCNFLNLYATMHLNNRFSDDNEIIIWDGVKPWSNFELMWSAFSRNRLRTLQEFGNKKVCFKNYIFALLPRMVDGLYYNTPLVPGCSKSGLFDAFNKHVLHRLSIDQHYTLDYHKSTQGNILRVTLISRSTNHRKILNELELERAIRNASILYKVRRVKFAGIQLIDQLSISQNTDILIGLHGAGLTHTLFLPDWASLFEIYDCQDKCYSDLARLRGVSYFSSSREAPLVERKSVQNPEELKKLTEKNLANHEKFSDYIVHIDKFLETLGKIAAKTIETRREYMAKLAPKSNETDSQVDHDKATGNQHTEL